MPYEYMESKMVYNSMLMSNSNIFCSCRNDNVFVFVGDKTNYFEKFFEIDLNISDLEKS